MLLLTLISCRSYHEYIPAERSGNMDTESAELQYILDRSVNELILPGIQAGYLKRGDDPVIVSSGNFDLKHTKTPVGNHHSFRIGSTTKMFVAALFCRFAEEGKLKLSDNIEKWFPGYPEASDITISVLLNHTSGIGESLFRNGGILLQSMANRKKEWDPDEIMNKLSRSEKPVPINERQFLYSNNNYIILGVIAEKIEEDKLSDILKREFFLPLGMDHTELLPRSDHSTIKLVPGYDEYIPLGPHLIKDDHISWDSLTFAAGALSSNCTDLLIWLDSLFHNEVISGESVELMKNWTDASDNGRDETMIGYGLGLALYKMGDDLLFGHPGAGFGGECFAFWDPVRDTSYVVVYNLSRRDNPAGKSILNEIRNL